MKKVIYLISIIFAVALLSTSCEKDPIVPEPDEITVADLEGNWDFVSVFHDDILYTDCNQGLLNQGYQYVKLSLLNVTKTRLILFDECVDDESPWDYTLTNNVLDIEGFRLEIQNVETFFEDERILKLKILNPASYHLSGGIYTLEKR